MQTLELSNSIVDFQLLFESLPGLYLVLTADLEIVAASDSYLQALRITRAAIIGKNIFEAFSVSDPNNNVVQNMRASFERVLKTGLAETVEIQKYDVQQPGVEGGFEEKYWSPTNAPILDQHKQVRFIIHRIKDVTDYVLQQRQEQKSSAENESLRLHAKQLESKRQQAENDLEDARLRLEAALVAGEIGTWTWDTINNRVIADENLAHFFSVSAADAAGGPIENYTRAIHPDDRERVINLINDALETANNYEAEYRLVQPDDSIRWFVARGRILRDSENRPWQLPGVVIDITVRKEAEKALRESEEHLRHTVELTPQITWTANAAGEIENFSDRWLELTGLNREEALGNGWTQVPHPDEVPRMQTAWLHSIKTGEPYDIEHQIRLVDNSYRWMRSRAFARRDEQNQIIRWYGTTEDIHERKLTEIALRESQARLALALQAGRAGTFEWDIKNNRNIWSPELEKMYGVEVGTFEGNYEAWASRVKPDDVERVAASIDDALKNRIDDLEYEFRAIMPNGEQCWFAGRARFEFDENNEPVKMFGINIDIDERKKSEAEREQLFNSEQTARRTAEEASRLKDEFLATVSHELRTPLNAILGWATMLRGNSLDQTAAARAHETIERNARAQAQLIEDLLDVSRIITGNLRLDVQLIDSTSFIEAAIEAVRPAADSKGVRIQQLIDTSVPAISGDSSRLRQVVWNLLSNAVKFTPRGGRVQARLERVNSHLEISVSDTGEGIEPNFLPFVFDRFRQADSSSTRRFGGLGLGLSIVRQLVELHGGSVDVFSEGLGKGSMFTVKLPLIPVYQNNSSAPPGQAAKPSFDFPFEFCQKLTGSKILLVDDELDTLEMLKTALEGCEAQIVTANSVAQAFEKLDDFVPDVLISDIEMPNQDGYELIKKLRARPVERGGHIPAIALTAYARSEDRLQILRAGFQTHLPKPVEINELIVVIASLIKR